jgi:hypothetical protein
MVAGGVVGLGGLEVAKWVGGDTDLRINQLVPIPAVLVQELVRTPHSIKRYVVIVAGGHPEDLKQQVLLWQLAIIQ